VVVETATYRLRAGADEAAAVVADHDVQVSFANHQHGMLRRTTARAADGEWLVVTLWASEGDALAADAAAATDRSVSALLALVEGSPVVRRYEDLGG
jgi:hypothetical protein